MDYLQTKFQYYRANIESKRPIGVITLYDYLYAIKHPKDNIVEIFKEVEKASAAGDKKLKAELKSKLYYFTPCVYTNGEGRNYECINSYTGFLIFDADNLETEFAKELKEFLFYTYPFVIASFLSASKKGVKAIIRIPVVSSVGEFKALFYGLMDEFQYFHGCDTSSKNCILPNYLTYDRELLYRTDATEWTKKGIQIDEFKEFEGEIIPVENVSEDDRQFVKNIIRKKMLEITDTAHVICRSTALCAGGYVAAGYISYDEAKDLMFSLVDKIDYCQKSPKLYKSTIADFIQKGMKSPLYLGRSNDET